MKREHILASLWMSLVTAVMIPGWSMYTMFLALMEIAQGRPALKDYLACIGSACLIVFGIVMIIMAIIALVKSRKNEEYFANKKGFMIALLVIEAILVIASLFASIYAVMSLGELREQEIMIMGGLYLTHVFAFATYTTSFVLTLLSVLKAGKKAKIEIEVVEE